MNNPIPIPSLPPSPRCVMISAGEASGDLHGANLVRAMRRECGSLFFCGIGGSAMKAAGVKIIVDADRLSVVGITEVLARLPSILNGMSAARKILRSRVPDLLILIDFPDFNLKLAAVAREQGIPVFYYITPQVWAWRQGRIHTIKQLVDRAAVILPFEDGFFRKHNIPVSFVGHPLLDAGYGISPTAAQWRPGETPVIGFLPGSRNKEVRRLLPVMLETAEVISRKNRQARFLVSCAPSVSRELFDRIAAPFAGRVDCETVTDKVESFLQRTTLVVAASGTVTLEAALSATPAVVVYRVSLLSYWLGRMLINLQHVSLINLIAEREVVPELLQAAAAPETIASEAMGILEDAQKFNAIRDGLLEVRRRLGDSGASGRAAGIALEMLSGGQAVLPAGDSLKQLT
ncbi:MAG: lipid-A-disaccharide synthase [Thermodesulfobacteriota bacterium]